MISRKFDDRGQVFPLYAAVVIGMVFAALAFFVFGQAATVRSDAQGAADAAALAAAREARDNLLPGVNLALLKPDDWRDVLEGESFDLGRACGAGEDFARRNNATGTCARSLLTFRVEVTTEGTVGDSVVPGTQGMHGTAKAVAEVVPRCELGAAPAPSQSATPSPSSTPTPTPTGSPKPNPVVIKCKGGRTIKFDPLNPEPWSTLARSLFDVRLAS
ncbi:pilus assembly protein TadG-related protein [Streptomyces sp. NPDC058612]|uniref:pilus assembly protein TadG-related protein n=1 Tax=Streptomyces sp. NPDC058612 TaxID=3346555 RepID=UPI003651CF9C